MSESIGYTKSQWDREIGWGEVPPEHQPRAASILVFPPQPRKFEMPSLPAYTQSDLDRLGCSAGWLEQKP